MNRSIIDLAGRFYGLMSQEPKLQAYKGVENPVHNTLRGLLGLPC